MFSVITPFYSCLTFPFRPPPPLPSALHLAITKYSEAVSAASGDSVATAAALCNRAAAELKLSNFGRALTDAAKAARLDPTNVKAHFRYVSQILSSDVEKLPHP